MNDQLVAETASYTTQNKHKRGTNMTSAGFEPAIPESDGSRPTSQTTRPPGSTEMYSNQTNVTRATETYATCVAFADAGLRFTVAAAYLEITLGQRIGDAEAVWSYFFGTTKSVPHLMSYCENGL